MNIPLGHCTRETGLPAYTIDQASQMWGDLIISYFEDPGMF